MDASRIVPARVLDRLDSEVVAVLASLSARALEGGPTEGGHGIDVVECRSALEVLAAQPPDAIERLRLWVGRGVTASVRARRLQDVLLSSAATLLASGALGALPTLRAVRALAHLLASHLAGASSATHAFAGEGHNLLVGLGSHLETARIRHEGLALLLVHCEAIERIDAFHGLPVGDQMRAAIARTLQTNVLREGDTLEEASRSEFACVLRPVSSDGLALLAAQKILRVLGAPVEFGQRATSARAAVGIVLFPEHGADAGILLQRAKAALRAARAAPAHYAIFSDALSESSADTLRYEARLGRAIPRNALSLAFQPQIELRGGRLTGAEALLRWNDEVLGPVPPNLIVAAAESSGLMHELSLWVITNAVQHCAAFRKIDPSFRVSINISPSDLREPDLPFHVDRALRTWGVPGRNIVLEITETAILADQKQAIEALHELKKHGVGLSIDDFGTGYSSINYLAQMPLNELKIDVMFVRKMLEVPQHHRIVRSLVELAHNLELKVVAEGIESEEIQAALAHMACDEAQGYFIGRPMPSAELADRLTGQTAR